MCNKHISADVAATVVAEENHKHAITFIDVYEEHLSESQLAILRHISKIDGFGLVSMVSERKTTSDRMVNTAEFVFGSGSCSGTLTITF